MNRIDKLISEMTLEDKILQMTGGHYSKICDFDKLCVREDRKQLYYQGIGVLSRIGGSNDMLPHEVVRLTNCIQKYFIEETKHKIPVLFLTEATSGTLARAHTVFPGNMNVGAMFDAQLTRAMGQAIQEEMKAVGERIALAPVVDLARDYRFGRCEESFSEDVYLTSINGINYIKGLQGESLLTGVAATMKHFAGQGMSDGGRNTAPIHLGDREFLDQYIAPFEACIKEANPTTLMAAYHELDGMPCHASHKLLKRILREKLEFDGLIISDGNGLRLLCDYQEYCKSLEAAAQIALEVGIEFEIDDVYARFLEKVVSAKPELEILVDKACRKLLELKEALGLFDDPYVDEDKVSHIIKSAKNMELSYKMAQESIVLLKNENQILPIDPLKPLKIGIVGPLADERDIGFGDYSYPTSIRETLEFSRDIPLAVKIEKGSFLQIREKDYEELFSGAKTFLTAMKERFVHADIFYEKGLKDTFNYHNDPEFMSYEDKLHSLKEQDIIFMLCGDHSGMGGFSDAGESVDRVEIGLAREQKEMIQRVAQLGVPVVLVLTNSRPYEITDENEVCTAVIEAFRAGFYSADAIVDVMTGKHNPSGRLPVTIPKHLGQMPCYYSQRITGLKQFWRNTYLDLDLQPLYAFGHGLSYSHFDYTDFSSELDDHGIKICFYVENNSKVEGTCVPQIYISKRFCSVIQPEQELKSFGKFLLTPGQKVMFSTFIHFDSLGYHNESLDCVLEDCEIEVRVGSSSKEILYRNKFKITLPEGIRKIVKKVFINPLISIEI